RKVTWRREIQRCPDHPKRFDRLAQVLCRECLSGTSCYWRLSGVKGWGISCGLGNIDKSWSLYCSGSSYSAWHNNKRTTMTAPHSSRIGVYLDFNAGTLSFHGVSDTMTLLHRFQATFTEYGGNKFYEKASCSANHSCTCRAR
ncbi:TRI16 protein, partial [Polyodon spathula]|nr:TRI16 protein [Polyodon spathula]